MSYIDICHDRCSLRSSTLYFAWLLPMSLIIIHNLIVFALVIRVLITEHPAAAHASITSTLALSCFHSQLFINLLQKAV